jgi:hypothetical protein
MTTSNDKPRFVCPVVAKRAANGNLEFHVTKRDGTVQIVPGPPGAASVESELVAFQPEGSDIVSVAFRGPRK